MGVNISRFQTMEGPKLPSAGVPGVWGLGIVTIALPSMLVWGLCLQKFFLKSALKLRIFFIFHAEMVSAAVSARHLIRHYIIATYMDLDRHGKC